MTAFKASYSSLNLFIESLKAILEKNLTASMIMVFAVPVIFHRIVL